jgi:hypothetical protein
MQMTSKHDKNNVWMAWKRGVLSQTSMAHATRHAPRPMPMLHSLVFKAISKESFYYFFIR